MNLRKILTPLAASLFLLASAVQARYVFVLPAPGSPSPMLQAFSDSLQQIGAVAVPPGATQVLTTPLGDKAIVIAQNSTAAVSFVSISGGQIAGAARTLNLDNQPATTAVLTPDGQRLVVLSGANPGYLFVVDVVSEKILTGGKVTIGSTPKDLILTRDSRYAAVLSSPSSLLTVVDLSNYQIFSQSGVVGLPGDANISLSPSGAFYVTGQYLLIEYSGAPPFEKIAQSSVISAPGKLAFSPDGRYALAPNNLLNGSSVVTFDFQVRGVNSPAGAQISSVPITYPGENVPRKVEALFTISDQAAIAWVPQNQRMYLLTYPVLSASELSLGSVGVPQNVFGAAVSDEFPSIRNLYYGNAGQVFRHDLITITALGSAAVNPGPVVFANRPSTAPAAQIFGYGGGAIVGPNTARTYYIRVVDATGRPVYNSPVTFTPETTGATLSNPALVTGMDGYAYVTATSPLVNGEFKVRAAAGAASIVLSSTVSGGTSGGGGGGSGGGGGVNPSLPKIEIVSGNGQLTQLYNSFTKPLVVRIVDAAGNPIAGKPLTWTESGGISFASPTIQTTDVNGRAEMNWVPGGGFSPGIAFITYTVVANTDIGNATFTLTAYPAQTGAFNPIPTVQLVQPTQEQRNITVKLGTKNEGAIQVIVVTSGGIGVSPGLPIPGVGLNVTTGNSDPTVGPVAKCDGGTPLTGQDGRASCTLIVEGKTGASPLAIDVGYLINFTDVKLTVNPGDPIAPVITSGNNQTGKPGATLPAPFVIQVTDNFGNLLQGLPVSWEVVTPNSVRLFNAILTTDYNGRASTSAQLGPNSGKYKVKALVGGKEAIFDVTIDTLATGFAKVSGDNQPIVPIGQAFPQPLVVVVTDQQNRPVPNASVTWSVTGPGLISAASTPTGTDGRAQVGVAAGSTPGTITVTASFPNLLSLAFTLQSRLPGPTLTATSFTNFATGEPGMAPGNLVLITGTGLAPNLRGTLNANLLGGRLPFDMAGVTVEFQFAGRVAYAPIYRVSNENGVESVLIQAPFELTGTAANAIVNVSGGNTTVTNIAIRSVSPGVIEDMISGRRAAVAIRSDGLVVSPESPARPGEEVRLYAIGIGQTTPIAETNRVGQPQQTVRAAVSVGVDDKGVQVIRAELAENLIGVYEIVFRIPADATLGNDRPLGFVIEEVPGQPVYANGSIISIGQ